MLQSLNTMLAGLAGRLRALFTATPKTSSLATLQAALATSEERFHLLADHIDEVFWLISPDGSEVQFVSKAYEELTGRSSEMLSDNADDWEHSMDPTTPTAFPRNDERRTTR